MLNDASSMVHLRSSSRTVPATSYDDFSMTLTTTTHSPQQLMAVWNHPLPDESEGPTLISHTALQSRTFRFYIRTPLSHSGHTVVPAQQHSGSGVGIPLIANPVLGMVAFAHARWRRALRELAMFVPGDDGSA